MWCSVKILDYGSMISFGVYHLIIDLTPSPVSDDDDIKIQVVDDVHPNEHQ